MQPYRLISLIFCALLFGCFSLLPVQAQTPKPLGLPVASPPGASTWLLGQPYGNTVGAYLRGSEWYEAGQRLHFGMDFSMPCGTPLVAMADGEVVFADDLGFGSAPHNLLIRHADAGVIVLYGHLLERPSVQRGQFVTRGQVVGLSGDPDLTCNSRPHLHLELRSLDYVTAYNPVDYIDADWHTLSLIGSFRSGNFQQDLNNPRQWMSIDDQPPVAFGGRALNAYTATYPDWSAGSAPANPPLARAVAIPDDSAWTTRRLTFDGCCAGAWWNPLIPERLYLIDGSTGTRASIFEWNTRDSDQPILIAPAPPAHLSPDGSHEIIREGEQTRITNRLNGAAWLVTTQSALPSFSADNSRLLWINTGLVAMPGQDAPTNEIWISDADGQNPRMVAAESDLSAQWLDSSRLMVSRRVGLMTTLGIYDAATGDISILGAWERLRNVTVSPGGAHLAFYLSAQADSTTNGVYVIETREGAVAQRLDWFGAWRWRDSESLFYIPLDLSASRHSLFLYNILTNDARLLIDNGFKVADGDWSVSADGSQLAYLSAEDKTIWLIEPVAR